VEDHAPLASFLILGPRMCMLLFAVIRWRPLLSQTLTDTMDIKPFANWLTHVEPIVVAFGLKVIGALIVFIVGRWLIAMACRLLGAAMTRQQFDLTVQTYLVSFINVALNIALVVVILGNFGVQTTTFAALVAGAGIAIGAAWSGLLSNFAAGIFLLVLRPYKVGDYIQGGGIEGSVTEIGLFGSSLNTPDNVKTIIGNAKIMAGDIKNFSANPYRRVDLGAQLSAGTDVSDAIARLKQAVGQVANIDQGKGVDVEVADYTEYGPKLVIRPYCHNSHYWQVFFDANRAIGECLAGAGYPAATKSISVYQVKP
jgi:small conductance mechanosensitive channel